MKPTVTVDRAALDEFLRSALAFDWNELGLQGRLRFATLYQELRRAIRPLVIVAPVEPNAPRVPDVPVPRDEFLLALCYLRRHRDGELVANNLDWEQSKQNIAALEAALDIATLEAALVIPDRG